MNTRRTLLLVFLLGQLCPGAGALGFAQGRADGDFLESLMVGQSAVLIQAAEALSRFRVDIDRETNAYICRNPKGETGYNPATLDDIRRDKKNAGECADLRGRDLSGMDLEETELSGANLEGANLRVARMGLVRMWGTRLRGADLSGADLRKGFLIGADLTGTILRGADLREATLRYSRLDSTDFSSFGPMGPRTDLGGADFIGVTGRRADFTGARLYGAVFMLSDFRGSTFKDADLRKGEFKVFCDLRGSDLRGCDLRGARSFGDAVVTGAGYDPRSTRLPFSQDEALKRGMVPR